MEPALFVTGYGTRLVPRSPFVLTFHPPRVLIQHQAKALAFGPVEGQLGFIRLDNSQLEDVLVEVDDDPPIPILALHTEHLDVPIEIPVKAFSTPEHCAWPFELQLEDTSERDEMVHIQGPFSTSADLTLSPESMRGVAEAQQRDAHIGIFWREWEYAHDGRPWRQRLYAIELPSTRSPRALHHFVVTAQCPSARRAQLFGFADRLTGALRSRV
jgi:hypothetical protein